MHLEDTELGESNLFRCTLILLDLSHINSCIAISFSFRKLHQKNIIEGEKFMKVMNKPSNPLQPQFGLLCLVH